MAELNPKERFLYILSLFEDIPNKIHINYSFGKKSSLLMWLAHEAGKNIEAVCVRAKNRMYPETLDEMDIIVGAWNDVGIKIHFAEIKCEITEGDPYSPCIQKVSKYKYDNTSNRCYVSTAFESRFNAEWYPKKQLNWIFPFASFTESEIHSMRYLIPDGLFLDLEKFDMPHWCANPICPRWRDAHPQSLEKFKRWSDAR